MTPRPWTRHQETTMTKAERFKKARRAVFELQEVVLDVLAEAKSSESQALQPNEIGKKIGIGGYARNYGGGGNDWSMVYGVLDSLLSEGQIAKGEGGAILLIDLD